jgi:hypothetical protein
MSDDDEENFIRRVAALLGESAAQALSDDGTSRTAEEMASEAWRIIDNLGTEGARGKAADLLIERLVPAKIDVKLWQAVALGRNVHLPVTDQYGPTSARIRPSDPKVAKPPRGNAYGRIHDKGQQAPSDFMKRQGQAVSRAAANIVRLEQELEAAREDFEQLESGLKLFATTCLLTELRKATASVFAMGPAWTLLRAIRGRTGVEVSAADSEIETQRILVVLHALREHEAFEQELKSAIHAVCVRYGGEAARRGKQFDDFDGPWDYEEIMSGLRWPPYPDER